MYFPKIERTTLALAAAALTVLCLALVSPVLARGQQDAPVVADEPGSIYFQFNSQAGNDGAYLGVQLEEETDHEEGGARVTSVVEDSPADRAGLEEGDVIVEFGGRTIRGPLGLTKRIHEHEPGDEVAIVVRRDGGRQTLDAELGARQQMWAPRVLSVPNIDLSELKELEELNLDELRFEGLQERLGLFEDCEEGDCPMRSQNYNFFFGDKPLLGVELIDTTPELREHLGGSEDQGLLIGKVLKNTPAEEAGILVGDLILEVGGDEVSTTSELRRALAKREGETFDIELVRDGKRRSVSVTLVKEDEDRPTGPRAFRRGPHPGPPAPPVPAALSVPVPAPAVAPLPSLPRVPAPSRLPVPAPRAPLPHGSVV